MTFFFQCISEWFDENCDCPECNEIVFRCPQNFWGASKVLWHLSYRLEIPKPTLTEETVSEILDVDLDGETMKSIIKNSHRVFVSFKDGKEVWRSNVEIPDRDMRSWEEAVNWNVFAEKYVAILCKV